MYTTKQILTNKWESQSKKSGHVLRKASNILNL